MKRIGVVLVLGSLMLGSCGIYRKYERTVEIPENVYGVQQVDQGRNVAEVGWKEMFTDAGLQTLIGTALESSADVKTALLRVKQAEITHKTSRLAYLPTVAFSPVVQAGKIGSQDAQIDYGIGVQASWQLDIFSGRITNARRKAKASAEYAKDLKQAIECRLISSVATLYYELLTLDRQVEIQKEMIQLYEKTYESVKTLYESGQYLSPAVNQTRAQLEQLQVDLIDMENDIIFTEHALCELLDEPYHHIERGKLSDVALTQNLGVGIPADLLRLRPDVRAAERNIEMAYYDVQMDKGAMYPTITLSATGGWGSLVSGLLTDPKLWFIQGVGSLVQPLFMGGQLRANLKISRMSQQIAVEEFRSTVIKAGHEVTNALSRCEMLRKKEPHIAAQVEAMEETVMANQELMNHGTSTYLEVLTSLQDLLKAQNMQVANKAEGLKAQVELYSALGGK